METASHLFLHCGMAFNVWSKVMAWLGIHFPGLLVRVGPWEEDTERFLHCVACRHLDDVESKE